MHRPAPTTDPAPRPASEGAPDAAPHGVAASGPPPGWSPARALRWLLRLAPDAATYAKRGFRGAGEPAQARLEHIGSTFLRGYHAALDTPEPAALEAALARVELEARGFAYEGAAMALGLLEALTPWGGPRVRAFLNDGGGPHVYLVHVGAGWAWARLRCGVERRLARMDPVLGWLGVDGYGFHEAFFHWRRYVDARAPPPLRGYAGRAFDQGLGRGLWFVEGAGVSRLVPRLRGFPAERQPDLWSGVGLACAYAGGVGRADLEVLKEAAGPCLPQVAQGVVFAARARERAGNPAPHTRLACEVLCGTSEHDAAALAERALAASGREEDGAGAPPRFERWRQHIQRAFAPAAR